VDLQEYREKSHATWEVMADGWDRRREWIWDVTRRVGENLVERLDPQPGQTILELAAGTGETGFAAAARIGRDGRLITTDFSPEMLKSARKRGEQLGLDNVEYRVMDAERMDLGDDSVDGVLCRWGYMLMADQAAALAETRRVLRDDGSVAFSVWGPPPRNPWAAFAGAALVQHGHMPAPEPGAPGIFAMAEPERIRELVTGAGFGEPEIEEISLEWRFDDFDGYWRFLGDLSGAVALVIKDLSEADQEAVRATMRGSMQDYRSNGGYVLPGLALNVVAS
jgi:ubiquinone/menaquinone biosynthesis C-methylase UbiE